MTEINSSLFNEVQLKQERASDRRSLMELATCLGVITTIPSLVARPRTLASAVRLGRAFDDVFDEALDRSGAQKAMTSSAEKVSVQFGELLKYQQSFGNLIGAVNKEVKDKSERERLIENSRLFVNSIATVENAVLAHPKSEWTLDFVKQYREAICLLWAVYFCSLSPDGKFEMKELPSQDGLAGSEKVYGSLLDGEGKTGRQINRLYSGSLVYQIMGDKVSIKDVTHSIPSFGTVVEEDRGLVDKLQQQYIGKARKLGMSLLEELGLVYLFPKVRSFLNQRT